MSVVSFEYALRLVQDRFTPYHVHTQEIVSNSAKTPPMEEALLTTERFLDCFFGTRDARPKRGVLMHAGRPFPIHWTAAWQQAGAWADSVIRRESDPAVLMDLGFEPEQVADLREQLLGAFRAVYKEDLVAHQAQEQLLAEKKGWSFGGRFAEAGAHLPEQLFHSIRDYFYAQEQIGYNDRYEFIRAAKFTHGFRVGMEIDYVMQPTNETFSDAYGLFPSKEDIPWHDLDYVVFAVHPHSLLVDRDVVWSPNRCFVAHKIMLLEMAELKEVYPHLIFIWGHPFWYRKGQKHCETGVSHNWFGMPAFYSMSQGQIAELVQIASAAGIVIEFNLDWKAHASYLPDGRRITRPPTDRWQGCSESTQVLYGEFLDAVSANNAQVSVATDLHVYELDTELERIAFNGEGQGPEQRIDAVAYELTIADSKVQGLLKKDYMDVPHVIREPFLQLVTMVQMMLSAGIKPENIWNFH